MNPVIELDRLSVRYGGFSAVHDVSLQVLRGELYALLGANGAGKTSTLETIEGHRAADGGSVRVFGEDPRRRRAVRPRTGIMLQNGGFSPELDARESVELFGALSGRKDDAARVLDAVGLGHRARVRVSQLSGGEQRRLDFATAIWGGPELIVLDEPTTGLDVNARDDLWAAVEALRNEGTTFLLTTHYLEEAQQYADRIGLMQKGRLQLEGTVADITGTLPARISFRLAPDAAVPAGAERLPDDSFTVRTTRMQEDLHALLGWAAENDVELQALEAGSPRLDDVLRSIADHQPERDEEER
ncbi:Daunorubicin/doxorubicin resistance ATP-binding protein DrrA [Microbacterium azadirachtae]|uniref:Daunorubicin/doxorubicin resistance ATP-binding protein DrrA n=1 Tax=Microbacterium azadirachtae TaxID=582680 RepID=A0A0F0L5Q5_9MICO|nr:ABC transporter ATP-binding protein [Microbacterium azadirachtae]KJL26856.1 Daunorubicin/doxorubicin resistance ATP-binding protein DrrA [Microbacterium azadirachtae]